MKTGFSWKSYDYRAVTAGGLMTLLALYMLWTVPKTVLACDRTTNRCDIIHTDRSRATNLSSVDLSSIQSVKEICRRPAQGTDCIYTVDLIAKDGQKAVFSDVDGVSTATRLGETIRTYLRGSDPVLHLSHTQSRSFEVAVLCLSVLLFALGVRKNLADKGII